MTMTLFEDKDFRGRSLSVTRNIASLNDTSIGNNPSSFRMGEGDAILLYKKEDWNGGVMFPRGGADVSDLGSAKDGGRALWGNAVTSVRITSFTVKLNVTVVTTEGGDLPRTGTSVTSITTFLDDAVSLVNQSFDNEKALIDIEISRIVCRADKISSISGIGRRRAFPALGRTRASWISSWSTALIPAMSARASSHGGAMSPSSR